MAKLAINGGPKLRQTGFSGWPQVGEETVDAVTDVLRSARWNRRRGGTRTAEFEQQFARYHDCEYGLCVSSGTAALEVAVLASGVEIGDEVIVPPYSFMATASAPLQVGAVPVFVDIDPETYNLNPALIEDHITEKTRAIFAVHFGGMAADMDAINAIARKHNLLVLEDCAHAHGGMHAQGKLGSLGDAAGWSFQAGKNLTSGEGGCVTTNDEEIYRRAVYYHDFWRSHVGLEDDIYDQPGDTQFPVLSWNYRMSEIMGAILHSQLGHLEGWAARRAENSTYLASRLAEIEGLANVRVDPFVKRNALHIFIFKYMNAEEFAGAPRELGCQSRECRGDSLQHRLRASVAQASAVPGRPARVAAQRLPAHEPLLRQADGLPPGGMPRSRAPLPGGDTLDGTVALPGYQARHGRHRRRLRKGEGKRGGTAFDGGSELS